jgi:hypothetical protein
VLGVTEEREDPLAHRFRAASVDDDARLPIPGHFGSATRVADDARAPDRERLEEDDADGLDFQSEMPRPAGHGEHIARSEVRREVRVRDLSREDHPIRNASLSGQRPQPCLVSTGPHDQEAHLGKLRRDLGERSDDLVLSLPRDQA